MRSGWRCVATALGPPRLRPEPAVTRHEQGSVDRRGGRGPGERLLIGELLSILEEEPAGCRAAAAWACGTRSGWPASCTWASPTPPGCSSSPTPPGCSTSAARTATSGCPRGRTTSGASRTWPTGGRPRRGLAGRHPLVLAGRQRDVAGKAVNPLSPDLVRHTAPAIRRSALTVLAEYPLGAGLSGDDLVALLRWRTPAADRLAPVPAMLAEAARLGVLVGGVLSTAGRGLLAGGEDGAAEGIRGLLPEPIDHVLAQPDLSLVAPGPLVSELADTLAVVADVESSGGATVFRVSEASVRRALDHGWSASDLHDFFRRVSRTPVPQALDYLVDDVARQHGRLRVGSIESYVRSDHGLLSQVLNDRRAASTGAAPARTGSPGQRAGCRRGAHRAPRGRLRPSRGEPGAVLTRPTARPRAADDVPAASRRPPPAR